MMDWEVRCPSQGRSDRIDSPQLTETINKIRLLAPQLSSPVPRRATQSKTESLGVASVFGSSILCKHREALCDSDACVQHRRTASHVLKDWIWSVSSKIMMVRHERAHDTY